MAAAMGRSPRLVGFVLAVLLCLVAIASPRSAGAFGAGPLPPSFASSRAWGQGQFLTTDPVLDVDPGNPHTWNKYAFVRGNPLLYTDPDGRSVWTKGAKLLLKGGDVAATFADLVGDVGTVFSMDERVGTGSRLLATGSIVSEFLPASGRDIKEGLGLVRSGVVALEKAGDATLKRIRHYTNRRGSLAIEREGLIRAGDKGRVFGESANRRVLSPRDAEDRYGLKTGRGRDYIETDVPSDRVNVSKNPVTGVDELQVVGDVPLKNTTVVRRP